MYVIKSEDLIYFFLNLDNHIMYEAFHEQPRLVIKHRSFNVGRLNLYDILFQVIT